MYLQISVIFLVLVWHVHFSCDLPNRRIFTKFLYQNIFFGSLSRITDTLHEDVYIYI